MSVRVYKCRTTGRNDRTGKRIVVFARSGRGWAHLEIGPFAVGFYS